MKKTLALIFIIIIVSTGFGQNYIDYYHLCNESDKEQYAGNTELALYKLEKAFEIVEYVHADQYEKASKLAIKNKDFEKGFSYAKKAVKNGSTSHFWKSKKLKKFRTSTYFKILNDSVELWEQQHLKTINFPYLHLIDSLHYLDQRIIRKNKNVKGNYLIDKDKLPKDLYDLDSMIFQTLLVAIEKYGFPSQQVIGISGYQKALIIVHHNFRLEQNEKYHPIVIQAVHRGEYLPSDFAGMYEQYYMWYKGRTYFTTFDKNLSEENLKRINKNRLKFGLKDLSAFKISKKGLDMKSKW